MDAFGKDVVLIETVGVGQSEIEIAEVADTTLVALQPGSGDSVQVLKAGVLEIADVFVVNKSDHPMALQLQREIRSMMEMLNFSGWVPALVSTQAVEGKGIDKLWDAIVKHDAWLRESGALTRQAPRGVRAPRAPARARNARRPRRERHHAARRRPRPVRRRRDGADALRRRRRRSRAQRRPRARRRPRDGERLVTAQTRERSVRLSDGAETRVEQWGERGPLIVGVHGLGASRRGWARIGEHLASRYRVVAYDQRGHGDSARVRDLHVRAQRCATRSRSSQALGEPVHALIGHSWGGAIAIGAGRAAPVERVVASTRCCSARRTCGVTA